MGCFITLHPERVETWFFACCRMYPSHTLSPRLFSRFFTTSIKMAVNIMATFWHFFTLSLTEPSQSAFRTSDLFMCILFHWCKLRIYVHFHTVAGWGTLVFSDAVKMSDIFILKCLSFGWISSFVEKIQPNKICFGDVRVWPIFYQK